jgi:hypothetical protein
VTVAVARSHGRGIGGHCSPNRGLTDSWITPRAVVESLGQFDLDPCACTPQPWPCARDSYTIDTDGLTQEWFGRVWLNPPYSNAARWLEKLAAHGDGIALIFARTETEMFRRFVWGKASGLMFLSGRLHFYKPNGERAKGNSGGPSVLVAYGNDNVVSLRNSGLSGSVVSGWAK